MTEKISWRKIIDGIKALKIENVEKIIAITRGGLCIAGIYSEIHNIKDINTLCISSYDNKDKQKLKILKHSSSKKNNILIIDDIADSGDTLKIAKKYYPNAITLTLHVKPHSKLKPDYYLWKTENWIIYPWEI